MQWMVDENELRVIHYTLGPLKPWDWWTSWLLKPVDVWQVLTISLIKLAAALWPSWSISPTPPSKKKKKCFLRRRPGLFPFLGGCGCLGGWHSVFLVGKLLHLYFLGVAVGILFYLQASLYFSCCFFKTVTMKTQFQPHSWSVNNCRLNNSGNVAESQGTAWWVPSWNWRWKKSKRWTSCQSSFLVTIMSCTSLLLPLFSSGKLFYNCFPQMVIEGIYFHL